MGAINSLPLSQSLIAKGLATDKKMAMVYSADYGYNIVSQLTDMANKGKAVKTENAKFQIPKLGSTSIYQQVASNVLSGSNLVVTFAASHDGRFRKGDIVSDSNHVLGRVEATSSITITLAPVTTTTWTAATQFASGSTARVLFDASPNAGSVGKSNLTVTPDYDFNFTSISRDTCYIGRRDMNETYVKWHGKNWIHSQQELSRQRFARTLENKYYFSERAIKQGADGEYYLTGGMRWNIINNGGMYYPETTQLTTTRFNDILEDFAAKTPGGARNIVALMGNNALFNLQQNVTQTYIQNAGSNNTFGGNEVKGINVKKYAVGDLEIEYTRYGLFNDPMFAGDISSVTGKPKLSSSILLIDMTPAMAADGSGVVPPIQRYYFGEKDMIYKFMPGMIGNESGGSSLLPADFDLAVSDIDGMSGQFLCDDGLYVIPDRMALIELTA